MAPTVATLCFCGGTVNCVESEKWRLAHDTGRIAIYSANCWKYLARQSLRPKAPCLHVAQTIEKFLCSTTTWKRDNVSYWRKAWVIIRSAFEYMSVVTAAGCTFDQPAKLADFSAQDISCLPLTIVPGWLPCSSNKQSETLQRSAVTTWQDPPASNLNVHVTLTWD